jgi:ribosomal protein L32E
VYFGHEQTDEAFLDVFDIKKKLNIILVILTAMEIIVELMNDHRSDAKLVELCAKVLLNIDNNEVHFNLEQHLQTKNLNADMYYEKFYHLCYIENGGMREWRNTEGQIHCTRKGVDGKILHAKEFYSGPNKTRMWWQNGKPCSPGFDENGHTLPTTITHLGWHMWENEDDQEYRLEIDKDGNVLPSSTMDDKIDWQLNDIRVTRNHVQNVYDAKYSTNEKIIHKLRVSPDAKLRELCNEVLKNIENNDKHFALSQYLQAKNIAAEEYYEKVHELCYVQAFEKKEWRNAEGKKHCTRKDKDGNIYPATITSYAKCWYKDGKSFSPGYDKYGYSLPHEVGFWSIWKDENGQEHRIEMGKDGKMLPSSINKSGDQEWWIHGDRKTEPFIRELFQRSQSTSSPITGIIF